jgi:Leucine-rich repeat (LRR) protein
MNFRNTIRALPETIGRMVNLEELWLDYNALSALPMTFHRIMKLRVLRLEGNMHMLQPPFDVIERGTTEVIAWCRNRYMNDQTMLKKRIISFTQDVLYQVRIVGDATASAFIQACTVRAWVHSGWQIAALGLSDPAFFEDEAKSDGSFWYCFQMDYFWSHLLPAIKAYINTNRHSRTDGYVHNRIFRSSHNPPLILMILSRMSGRQPETREP